MKRRWRLRDLRIGFHTGLHRFAGKDSKVRSSAAVGGAGGSDDVPHGRDASGGELCGDGVREAPIIETARLRLRGHHAGDQAACAALWGDPEVTRYIGGRPFTAEEVWSRLLRYVGHWAVLGFGYWVVEEKASGEFVGEAGFADYRREMKPSLDGAPEIGWVLTPRFHGRGYATEAVRAVVEWGDAKFDGRETACIIKPENAASVRVAEKCGYRATGRAVYSSGEVLLFRR